MQLPAPALDAAIVGKLPQHALEDYPIGILHAEGACNLAGADFSRPLSDERDKIVFGRKSRLGAR
jgi:hypothetical protein